MSCFKSAAFPKPPRRPPLSAPRIATQPPMTEITNSVLPRSRSSGSFRFSVVAATAALVAVLLIGAAGPAAGAASLERGPTSDDPLRLAIAGLVHGHVHGVLGQLEDRDDVRLVGVWAADAAVRSKRQEQYGLPDSLLYGELGAMLDATRPGAVATFTSTYDHPTVVEAAARRGIDVMMEKPLAVNMAHGRRILEARNRHPVHVIVNYETTWYPSNQAVYRRVHDDETIGALRKIVVRDGHEGPKEIGVSDEFLSWLTDPKLNGGGALFDFGCYGANLITWLAQNRRPSSVTALTQHIKTDPVYAEVDDEATIVLQYPEMQGLIQASWNWPYSRKDMSVYGTEGALFAETASDLALRADTADSRPVDLPTLSPPKTGPLTYLRAVSRGETEPTGLSSLENNLIVTEILDAARTSAAQGRSVSLPDQPPY